LRAVVGAVLVVMAAVTGLLQRASRSAPLSPPARSQRVAAAEPAEPRGGIAGAVGKLDRFQQRHAVTAVPIAVVKKFGDDNAGSLAALVAYYGFLSLFPLLLAFVSILGFVLADRPDLQQDLVDTAFGQFPVIGDQLRGNIGAIQGNVWALILGVAGAIWAGMGAMQASQQALNETWAVPLLERPNAVKSRLRSLAGLALLGSLLLGTSALSALASSLPDVVGISRIGLLAGTLVADILVVWVAFQILTARHQPWKALLPGAVLAGAAYFALQLVGSIYLKRVVAGASVYGVFAIVIGLMAWLFLLAQVTMYASELNVVLHRRLWPRSLRSDRLREADRKVFGSLASRQRKVPQQQITVDFEDPAGQGGLPPPPPTP
jgi:inner membrane protein YhjD